MILNLKNIKNTTAEIINKAKNIKREDLTGENVAATCKMIFNDYIKTFDFMKLSYLPFIGWFIPMYLNRDEFQKYHAKQGFVLAVYFTSAGIFLICFKLFVPERADIVQFLVVMLVYVHYLVYFILCFLGTRMIGRNEKGEFPYISKYVALFTSKIDI